MRRLVGVAIAVACASAGLYAAALARRTSDDAGPTDRRTGGTKNTAAARARWTRLVPASGLGPPGARRVTIAAADDGRAVAAWETSDASGGGAVHVADEGDGFVAHAPGGALAGRGGAPAIAALAGGAAFVAWQQVVDGNGSILVAGRDGPRAPWNDPTSLDDRLSSVLNAYEPVIGATRDGELVVVWNQWMGANFGVAVARRAPGGAWERPRSMDDVLSPHVFYSNGPRLAVGRDGQLAVTWYQSPDGNALMVFASERANAASPLGKPAASEFVSQPGGPVSSDPIANPKPAIAADGLTAIVWTQDTGPGPVARVHVSEHPRGGSFSRASRVEILSSGDAVARGAQLAFGARGDLFVVWEESHRDLIEVVGAHRDEHGKWEGRPRVLSRANHVAIGPVIAAGERSQVVAAWSERVENGWVTVAARTQTGSDFGEVEEISIPSATSTVPAVAVASDPRERVVIAWTEGGGLDGRVAIAGSL